MAPNLLLIFNHSITPLQEEDAKTSLAVGRIIDLPPDLKELWRNVPPDFPEIRGYLEPLKDWLEEHAEKGDFVLIQGDFGACYLMVNFAFESGLVPVYSTTHREATEEYLADGSMELKHVFRHRMFRRYGR